jgi:hypothetical protein
MRILNQDDNRPVKSVLIMLTPSEAKELVDKINQLTPEKGGHLHVNDESFLREVTIAIYTPVNMDSFHRRVIDLIEKEI